MKCIAALQVSTLAGETGRRVQSGLGVDGGDGSGQAQGRRKAARGPSQRKRGDAVATERAASSQPRHGPANVTLTREP